MQRSGPCVTLSVPSKHDFQASWHCFAMSPEDYGDGPQSAGLLAEEFFSQAALVKISYALLA